MTKKSATKGSYIYPWDKWLAKPKITLRRGEDFDCQPHSMAIQIRGAASRRNIEVSVLINDDIVTVVRK